MQAHEFWLAGQRAWFHDEGFAYGPVHTYDALHLPGPNPRERKVHVLVPWNYDQMDQRYPVVYMNDGHTAFFSDGLAGRSWRVAETLARLTDAPAPRAIWVRASSGADSTQLVGALGDLAAPAGANVYDQLEARETENAPLRILTWAIVALLGFSVAIALVGIANTLGLSVLERVREHALLRALGLTRRQLRQMLAAEAVLLSLVAALLGTGIGIGFAWVGYQTFVKQALTNATMQIPWPLLGAVLLSAALAGLIASVLPARRAARVTPAAGLSFE